MRFTPRSFLIAIAVLLSSAPARAQIVVAPSTFNESNGHYYEAIYVPSGISWYAASSAAISRGGYLATITSGSENDFVFNLIDSPEYWRVVSGISYGPWLGGHQPSGSPEPAGNWRWDNGEAFFYSNWRNGEPNNDNFGEESLHYFALGQSRLSTWNDQSGMSEMRGYVVEYPALPLPVLPPEVISHPDPTALLGPGHNSTYSMTSFPHSLRVTLNIQANADGFTPHPDLLRRWELGAERIWSAFTIVDTATLETYPIVLDVNFVTVNPDVEITIHRGTQDGELNRPGVLDWYTQDDAPDFPHEGFAAHEVGHLLGAYDEYPEEQNGARTPGNPSFEDPESIMAVYHGVPKARHYQYILDWVNSREGKRSFVLGQGPPFSTGVTTDPISENPTVPEPPALLLWLQACVIIVLCNGSIVRRRMTATRRRSSLRFG